MPLKKSPRRSTARANSSAKTVVGAVRARTRGGARTTAASAAKLVDEGEIGSGGSGSVRKAYDPNLRRVVATKVLASDLARLPEHIYRFIEEARLMARLDHPNIVPIHDLVAEGQSAYFVMKRVVGQTLDARVEAQRGLGSDGLHELLTVFLKVCDAVAFAHSRGVIHCDLKPENIMVGEFGEVYLMDWGIASQKAERVDAQPRARRTVRGTPAYMSPEQAEGSVAAISERTDIFGLGVVLYYILTGRPPFDGKTATQSLARARKGEHEDLESAAGVPPPPGLVRVVRKAMAPEPQDRYATVLELRHAVDTVLRSDWNLPTKVFAPGAIIVREGDFADAAYIIVRGQCAVTKTIDERVQAVRTLEPGAVFGETGVLSGDRRTATVRAVGEVVVKVVTRELFRGQLGNDTWMGKFVLALADRFRELDAKLAAIQRVAGIESVMTTTAGDGDKGAPLRPLEGRVVALPETRELDRLAELLETEGARAWRCPLVSILDAPEPAPVEAWLRAFAAGGMDDVVFLTGEGLRRLVALAERRGFGPEVVAALGRVRKITRGPKPARALKELGLSPDIAAAVPTSKGVMDELAALDLRGRRVGVQLYGEEPNRELGAFIEAAGAQFLPVAPYIYAPASDGARVVELIRALGDGGVHVVAFTSASQVDRLFAVAKEQKLEDALAAGWTKVRVAAIGPIAAETLRRHGVEPTIIPEKAFVMKRLVQAIVDAVGGGKVGSPSP